MAVSGQICVVAGHTRGFTRSVVEALLKRGSKVIFTSSSLEQGEAEQDRLGQLYGPSKVHCAHTDHRDEPAMEQLLHKAIKIFGEVNLMINTTAQDNITLNDAVADMNVSDLDKKVDKLVLDNDVKGIKRSARMALKYMGRHNGFGGGTLLNIASPVELEGVGGGSCTVLGTTRGLGLARLVNTHGVKVVTIYQPSIDYPATPSMDFPAMDPATPHVDPSWNPGYSATYQSDKRRGQSGVDPAWHHGYSATYQCDKRRGYSREYTGYMALHAADTASPGTAWTFDPGLKLTQVTPDRLKTSCGIANKMCFWLGCPMADDLQLLPHVVPQTNSDSTKLPIVSSPSLEQQDN